MWTKLFLELVAGLVLDDNVQKKWKTRWCVLEENQFVYHHKKNKALVIDSLPLHGCSIVCPCPDVPDISTQGLLKLHLTDGEVLYLIAGGSDDRDQWAHVFGAVLRSVSTSLKTSRDKMVFQDFRTHANVSEIIGAIQDPDAGVKADNHLRGGIVFKNCFTGRTIVDWLLRWSLVRNRANGAAMGQALLKLGHLQEVDLKDGTSGFSLRFNDSDRLYRFTSINLGAKRNSFYDSTDSDSSSSEDEEDSTDRDELKVKKSKAVKEAFLVKKRTLRKGWKIVKVLARETPPSLQYHRAIFAPTVDDKFPSTLISLASCKVTEVIKPPSSSKGHGDGGVGSTNPARGPRFSLVIRTKKGKTFTFRMKDEQEKVEWLALLTDICSKVSTTPLPSE